MKGLRNKEKKGGISDGGIYKLGLVIQSRCGLCLLIYFHTVQASFISINIPHTFQASFITQKKKRKKKKKVITNWAHSQVNDHRPRKGKLRFK